MKNYEVIIESTFSSTERKEPTNLFVSQLKKLPIKKVIGLWVSGVILENPIHKDKKLWPLSARCIVSEDKVDDLIASLSFLSFGDSTISPYGLCIRSIQPEGSNDIYNEWKVFLDNTNKDEIKVTVTAEKPTNVVELNAVVYACNQLMGASVPTPSEKNGVLN